MRSKCNMDLAEGTKVTLRMARLAAGVTQLELQERTGLSQPRISKLEYGHGMLTTAEKIAIEAALCAVIDWEQSRIKHKKRRRIRL